MGSAEDAFGVFSLEQQDPEAGIGQGSEFGGSLLRFWKGPYFVTVLGNGTGKELEAAVLDLGRELAKGIKETGEPPSPAAAPAAGINALPAGPGLLRSQPCAFKPVFFYFSSEHPPARQRGSGPFRPVSARPKQALPSVDTLSHIRQGPIGLDRLPVGVSAGGRSRRRRADGRRRSGPRRNAFKSLS